MKIVPQQPILEYEQTYNPFREELGGDGFSHTKGVVKVPTRPGLGIEIDREILARYKVA
jgi:D-galactarolactone cycloisomerase